VSEMLDDLGQVQEYDEQAMLSIVGHFDRQLSEALEIGAQMDVPSEGPPIRSVLISGLGGSAIGGDFIRTYLGSELKVPLLVNRNYFLPGWVDDSTLVLMSSYSGNTEETISAFHEARRNDGRVVCITSNGELLRLAREYGYPCIVIPGGRPPRTALGYSAIPLLMLLARLGVAPDKSEEVERSLPWVRRKIQFYGPDSPIEENPAKSLALQLHGQIPVIYGSQDRLDTVAIRWRGQFAENGKQLVYSAALPEMNHNEIVGWRHPGMVLRQLMPVFLRDLEDHPRVQIRAEITREVLASKAGTVLEYWTDGDSWLERLWTLILLGDYASMYLAFLNNEDPTPVEAIEVLKNRLKESP
jgi:glucose/mannose-6-phosphate isomerase